MFSKYIYVNNSDNVIDILLIALTKSGNQIKRKEIIIDIPHTTLHLPQLIRWSQLINMYLVFIIHFLFFKKVIKERKAQNTQINNKFL